MHKEIETLNKIQEIKQGAEKILKDQKQYRPKLKKTFSAKEATEYLQTSKRVVDTTCESLGINPRANKEIGWSLSIDEVYAVRDALQPQSRLKKALRQKSSIPEERRTQVIAIQNQKGGVGKSTSCITLASGIATQWHEKLKVCVIDLDGQSTVTSYQPSETERTTIGELLQVDPESEHFKEKVKSCVYDTSIPNLKIMVAGHGDRDIETVFHASVATNKMKAPYTRLAKIIEVIKEDFDLIFIDTAPALSYASINAYFAATAIILPIKLDHNDIVATCEYLTYLPDLYKTLIAENHKGYDFIKFLITNHEENSHTSEEARMSIYNAFNNSVLLNTFKKSEAVRLCALDRNTIYDLNPSTYEGHKQTFKAARKNVDELLLELMITITAAWK